MAGESARDVARRQREKAKRLERSAVLWERGAEGEETVAAALAQLPRETWTVFHDVRWPGRRCANVDHVVVGPPGVFVIDAKNWSGSVIVRDNVLRQNGRSREQVVVATAESAMAIRGLVPLLRPDLVTPVLCFVRDEPMTGWARDVMVCSTDNVVDMLLSRPAILTVEELRRLTLDVDAGLRVAAEAPPVTPPTARSLAPGARARRSRGGRRSSAWSPLAKAFAVLVVVAGLLMRPNVVTGPAEGLGDWFVETITDTSKLEPQKQEKGPAQPDRQRLP